MSFNTYPYTDFHEMNDDWVIAKVKEMIAAWSQTQSAWTDMQSEFASLKAFVNTYFEELDVQEEINHKLDAMAADGSLATLLQPYIPDAVTSWLENHVDPESGYVLDDTLSITNAAADAKAVGDLIRMELIESGTDMDDVKDAGFFRLASDGTYTNLPVLPGTLPLILVASNILQSGTNIRQICIPVTTGKIYTRKYTSGAWSEWASYDDEQDISINGLKERELMKVVTTGTDINDMDAPGVYRFEYAGSYTNLPIATNNYPMLLIFAGSLSGSSQIRQIAFSATTGKIYIRYKISGSFGNWVCYDDVQDTKINTINSILTQGVVANGSDLNDYKTEGTYRFGVAYVVSHMPASPVNRPILIVISSDMTSNPSNVRQIIVDPTTGISFTRSYVTGSWSVWTSAQYAPTNLDTAHHTIAHRGVPQYSPEGTKPSYVLAKNMGLLIAEADVRFTSDNVPVVFHNASYTDDGVTYNIADITYEQFMTYDQGAAYSAAYTGTYGLSLSAFLDLCKDIQIHPVIEFKTGTAEQIEDCLDLIDEKRVKVFNYKASVDNLKVIIDHDPYASVRLGADDYSAGLLANVTEIVNYGEKKHTTHCIYATYGSWTAEQIEACRTAGAIIGVSSINNQSQLEALNQDVDIIFSEYGYNVTEAITALNCQ